MRTKKIWRLEEEEGGRSEVKYDSGIFGVALSAVCCPSSIDFVLQRLLTRRLQHTL